MTNSAARKAHSKKRADTGTHAGQPVLPWWCWALVGGAAMAIYGLALSCGLVYDDHFLIARNHLVLEGDFLKVWTTHYWGGYGGNETGQYRPLTVLSLVFDGLGGISPFRFHLTNVLLHAANSLLALAVCRQLGLGRFGALAGALLFAVHPIHAEAAAGITFGRADLLAGLGVLGGLLFYMRTRYWASLAAFGFGLLSKESALVLLGLIACWDLAQLTPERNLALRLRLCARAAWLRWAGFGATFVGYLGLRRLAAGLGFSAGSLSALNNPLVGADWSTRLYTAAKLLWSYAALIVWPQRLSVEHGAMPLATTVLDSAALAGVALGVGGLALWIFCLGRRPHLFMAGALFWVPYAAVSQIAVLLNAMFQERFLYVPALGLFALVGFGLAWVRQRSPATATGLLVLGLLAYSGRTAARVQDWQSDLTLFRSAVEVYPNSAKMWHNLANALVDDGQPTQAIAAYGRALAIQPEALTYNNLGNAYAMVGRLEASLSAYDRALRLDPDYAEAWANCGLTLMRVGRFDAAASDFEKAVELGPDNADTFYNLGTALAKIGAHHRAVAAYGRAIALRPDWAEAHFNLGNECQLVGQTGAAAEHYRAFLKLWKGDAHIAEIARQALVELNGQQTNRGAVPWGK